MLQCCENELGNVFSTTKFISCITCPGGKGSLTYVPSQLLESLAQAVIIPQNLGAGVFNSKVLYTGLTSPSQIPGLLLSEPLSHHSQESNML